VKRPEIYGLDLSMLPEKPRKPEALNGVEFYLNVPFYNEIGR
jgi:hypothetical protein